MEIYSVISSVSSPQIKASMHLPWRADQTGCFSCRKERHQVPVWFLLPMNSWKRLRSRYISPVKGLLLAYSLCRLPCLSAYRWLRFQVRPPQNNKHPSVASLRQHCYCIHLNQIFKNLKQKIYLINCNKKISTDYQQYEGSMVINLV